MSTNTWFEEVEAENKKCQEVLDIVKSTVSPGAFEKIEYGLKESGQVYDFEIVTEPIGEPQEFGDFEYIEGVYIDQTTNGGYSGDEFTGTCCVKIADNQYFKYSYSM